MVDGLVVGLVVGLVEDVAETVEDLVGAGEDEVVGEGKVEVGVWVAD